MKGSEARMTVFMEGADKRFVIPDIRESTIGDMRTAASYTTT